MQQYIVRREQDFKRLEENNAGTQVSEQIRAMILNLLWRPGSKGANFSSQLLQQRVRLRQDLPCDEDPVSQCRREAGHAP